MRFFLNHRSDFGFGSTGEFWASPAQVVPDHEPSLISEIDLDIPSPEGELLILTLIYNKQTQLIKLQN